MTYVCQNTQKLFQKAEIATKNLMLGILLSNLKLENKNLTFALNLPCWGAGKIQFAVSKVRIDTWVCSAKHPLKCCRGSEMLRSHHTLSSFMAYSML